LMMAKIITGQGSEHLTSILAQNKNYGLQHRY